MTANCWTLKNYEKGDKNIVIFSLQSLGRSDIASLPAGSGRANIRSHQAKSSSYDFTINGAKSKVAKQAKPAQSKPPPPVKAAKPKVAKPAVKGKAPMEKAPGLRRPKGVPKGIWKNANAPLRKLILSNPSSYSDSSLKKTGDNRIGKNKSKKALRKQVVFNDNDHKEEFDALSKTFFEPSGTDVFYSAYKDSVRGINN